MAIGPMTFGEILGRGLSITWRRFGAFFGLACLFLAPLYAAMHVVEVYYHTNLGAIERGDPRPVLMLVAGGFVVLLAGLILQSMGMAASLGIVAHEFLDRRIGVGAALGFALRRFLPLLLATVCVGLVVALGVCPGCLALCVPAFLFRCWFSVVAPVIVVEHAGPFEAMQRSFALTAGFRWIALAFVGIEMALNMAAQCAGNLVGCVAVLPTLVERGAIPSGGVPPSIPATVVMFLCGAAVLTYTSVVWSLFYFDLRIRKEGFDLAAVSGAGA